MADGLAKAAVPMIILPLVISTAMRFIQGSGTVAMTTAASISAPILLAAGVNPMLGAIACCVGSLLSLIHILQAVPCWMQKPL